MMYYHRNAMNRKRVSGSQVYATITQLLLQTEEISWNRFYNFLMGNSILILAWATIFAIGDKGLTHLIVLASICIVGGLSGIAWRGLGKRSRAYVEKYKELGAGFEAAPPSDQKGFRVFTPLSTTIDNQKTCNDLAPRRQHRRYPPFGSYRILTIGPLLFLALYTILLCAVGIYAMKSFSWMPSILFSLKLTP